MNDRIDDFFEREREAVPLLAPPSGRFEQLQTVARRRRNRNTTVVSVAAAVVLAVAGTGTVLGAQQFGGNANRTAVAAGATSLAGYSATPSAGQTSVGLDPTVPADFKAWSITFINNTSWALGGYSCGSDTCAVVLQTTSYPHPWAAIARPDAAVTRQMGLSSGTATIRMALGGVDGWIVDAQQVLSTHDGGRSWAPVTELADKHITALEAWGDKTYALGPDGNSIWLSTDHMVDHWVKQVGVGLPAAEAGTVDTLIPDNSAVAAVRTTGRTTTVSVSKNDGHTWAPVALPCETTSGPAPLFSLLDASVGRVVCGNGDTYRVFTDPTERPVQTTSIALSPSGSDPVVARSIASNDVVTVAAYTGTGLWSTDDKGLTWHQALEGNGFSYVGLTSDSQGVALTAEPSNAFWITYDGGKTWEAHPFR